MIVILNLRYGLFIDIHIVVVVIPCYCWTLLVGYVRNVYGLLLLW